MPLAHKKRVEKNFSQACDSYNDHALVQRQAADVLCRFLPSARPRQRILEIGCGTGFMTAHLAELFPDAEIFITDISAPMLQLCKNRFSGKNRFFCVMDGEHPHLEGPFDLVVSNMTFQWFEKPREALQKLRSLLSRSGKIFYSTLGEGTFEEWKTTLALLGLRSGIVPGQTPDNILKTERLSVQYPSGPDFLGSLRQIGAQSPVAGYRPQTPRQLKAALALFEERFDSKITYEVHYAQH